MVECTVSQQNRRPKCRGSQSWPSSLTPFCRSSVGALTVRIGHLGYTILEL